MNILKPDDLSIYRFTDSDLLFMTTLSLSALLMKQYIYREPKFALSVLVIIGLIDDLSHLFKCTEGYAVKWLP